MVLGETEILGQIKAYDLALPWHGSRLSRRFEKRAFNGETCPHGNEHSTRVLLRVSSVVELAEKIFSSLDDQRMVVIGAGDTSEKTRAPCLSRGAGYRNGQSFAGPRAGAHPETELGGKAVSFDD